MAERKRRNFMMNVGQSDWIDEKAEDWDVDKSFIVRRAVNFYRGEGHKRDKILKKEMEGKL